MAQIINKNPGGVPFTKEDEKVSMGMAVSLSETLVYYLVQVNEHSSCDRYYGEGWGGKGAGWVLDWSIDQPLWSHVNSCDPYVIHKHQRQGCRLGPVAPPLSPSPHFPFPGKYLI